MRNYNIESDLKQEQFQTLKLVQGDRGNKIKINVYEDGQPVSLTGCSVTAKYKRADGEIINDGVIENIHDNFFDAVMDSSITKVAGTLKMLFTIEKDAVKVSAFLLLADVREGIGESSSSGGSAGGGEVTVDLSDYYKKIETYSRNQIDARFKDIAKQSITTEERTKLTNLKNYDDSEIKNKLNEKANKNEIFTMANMGQDIKEAMTGGSVAVVGKNSVLTENIVDKQITPITTNFFNIVNYLSLSNLKFLNAYVDFDGTLKSDLNSISLIIKVQENTRYYLKSKNITFNRANAIGSTKDDFNIDAKGTYLGTFSKKNGVIDLIIPKGISWICIYVYNGTQYTLDYMESEKSNIYLFKDTIPLNEYDTVKKEFLPADILYENKNISEFIRNNSITPKMTSFFENFNLLEDSSLYELKDAICDITGKYTESNEGKVCIFRVNSNTKYFITLPSNSNRHLFLESADYFINEKKYNILNAENLSTIVSNKTYSFTTSENTKYVLSYYYNGDSAIVNGSEFFLTTNINDLGKSTSLKEEYIPRNIFNNKYEGKKILTMGDSITAINENEDSWQRCWRKYFKEVIHPSQFSNTAVPGATWCDKEGTIYDGVPVLNGVDNNVNNVMGNQIEKLLRAKDSTHPNYSKVEEFDNFDIIIIACGTNDTHRAIPTNEEIESNFYNNNNAITDLSLLNRKTWTGAMRYCIDTLRTLYPNARIYVCTPIQKTTGDKYIDILDKNTIIKSICRRLSVCVIDTMICGIYDMTCPTGGQEGDYNDGLHLSPQGASKMGYFIANKIKNNYY